MSAPTRCKHCVEPIVYDEVYREWYHADEHGGAGAMECYVSEDRWEKSWAEPIE